MRIFSSIVGLALGAVGTSTIAGGTLETRDLDALLAQQPNVRAALISSLKLSESAFAEIRFGSHFVHIGGATAGPYTIRATAPDGHEVDVVLCTTFRLLDATGGVVSEKQLERASSIDEHLDVVLIQDIQTERDRPKCP